MFDYLQNTLSVPGVAIANNREAGQGSSREKRADE